MHLINDVRSKIFVILSLRIGGKLQYKIIVIVSLFMKLIFRLNCSQKAGNIENQKFLGEHAPDPPPRSVNQNSYNYAPDSSCNIHISRALLFKAEIGTV
jgi:hypothetical protein